MRIERVKLSNVRCHAEFEATFAPGVVLLLGPNGIGKTSVLQGIAWALFDWLPVKHGDFIRRGAKRASVEVDFSHDGKSWRVTRSTKRGLDVQEQVGSDYLSVAQGVKNSRVVICEALGLNQAQVLSALYRDAVGGRQGSVMDGFELASKSRQDYWGKILHLDRYRQAYQKLREPVAMLDRKRGDAHATIIACKINLEALGVGQENNVEETLVDVQERACNLTLTLYEMNQFYQDQGEALAAVQRREALAVQASQRIASLDCQIESLGVSLTFADLAEKTYGEKMPALKEELEEIVIDSELEASHNALLQEKAALVATIQVEEKTRIRYRDAYSEACVQSEGHNEATAELRRITRYQGILDIREVELLGELDSVVSPHLLPEEEGPCPVCERHISTQMILDLADANKARAEARQRIEKYIDRVRHWRGIYIERAQRANALTLLAKDLWEKEAARAMQDALVARLETEYEGVVARTSKCDGEVHRQRKVEKRIRELEIAIAALEASYEPGRAEKLRQQLTGLQTEKDGIVVDPPTSEELQVARLAVVEASEAVDKVRDALERVRVECDRLIRARDVRVVLVKAQAEEDYYARRWSFLSRIRTVIREAGPYIAEGTVKQVAVIAQEIWQSFGKSEQLAWAGDYELSLGDRSFTLLSGGEKVAAALAIRLAIAQFTADLKWICLDEPTASLDTQTRMALAEIISRLPLEQVIVVSHDDTFTSCADQVIDLSVSL